MRNKKGLALSILFVFFICGVTIPLFMTNHRKVKADTITDLTYSTWIINEDYGTTELTTKYINFTSNNNDYASIRMNYDDGDYNLWYGGSVVAFYPYNWINYDRDKTIYITGGSDVTNQTLINWLSSNATLQGYTPPTPAGTEITHKYWASYLDINLSNNEVIGDNNISYKVLLNTYTDNYNDETLTGLTFTGLISNDEHSYIISIDGSITTILYQSNTSTIDNPMLLEFTLGDYMDSDLYDLMNDTGVWFDDARAYMAGTSFGSIYGFNRGVAYGEANATQYTSLVTNILNGLGNILSIQVFPNITIGLIIGLPLLLGVLVIVLKILRG